MLYDHDFVLSQQIAYFYSIEFNILATCRSSSSERTAVPAIKDAFSPCFVNKII